MEGNNWKVATLFSYQNRYLIPEYQRHYAWNIERWHSLIKDTIEIENRKPDEPQHHWLGIFLVSEGKYVDDAQEYTVIDGQQRLVTLRLWLAALEHTAKKAEHSLGEMKFAEIRVQDADRAEFEAALSHQWENPRWRKHLGEIGLLGCYCYFRWGSSGSDSII
jgi:hypothetical protein